MKRNSLKLVATVACGIVLSGCIQTHTSPRGNLAFGPTPMDQMQLPKVPAAQPAPVSQDRLAVNPYRQTEAMRMPVMAQQEDAQEVSRVKERVRRLERALIRLDRRMQLVERNELSRMTSPDNSMNANESMDNMNSAPSAAGFRPMSMNGGQQPAALPVMRAPVARGAMQAEQGGFRPVSASVEPYVTSALQAAPAKARPQMAMEQPRSSNRMLSGFPSLADDTGFSEKAKDADLAVWTVNYENKKVWPEKKELSRSQGIVAALKGDEPVALFARGARPSSKEFRERVRALSKYLSKVADMENVPIAAMSAEHLDDDTIEILLTR